MLSDSHNFKKRRTGVLGHNFKGPDPIFFMLVLFSSRHNYILFSAIDNKTNN